MKNPSSTLFLCYTSDIPNEGCKGFSLSDESYDTGKQDIFIINRGHEFFAYKNSCPHTGATLNWQPDVFMDYDNFYIQCSIHAARFEAESGLCIWGPCVKQSLIKAAIHIIDKNIYLLDSQKTE